jgi:hypothetical protein
MKLPMLGSSPFCSKPLLNGSGAGIPSYVCLVSCARLSMARTHTALVAKVAEDTQAAAIALQPAMRCRRLRPPR